MLQTPFAYIVTFNLSLGTDSYKPFFDELKASYRWFNYTPGVWIVLRNDTLVDFSASLRSKIFQPDRLLVMPAKGPGDGWMPADAWNWLHENVTNLW